MLCSLKQPLRLQTREHDTARFQVSLQEPSPTETALSSKPSHQALCQPCPWPTTRHLRLGDGMKVFLNLAQTAAPKVVQSLARKIRMHKRKLWAIGKLHQGLLDSDHPGFHLRQDPQICKLRPSLALMAETETLKCQSCLLMQQVAIGLPWLTLLLYQCSETTL